MFLKRHKKKKPGKSLMAFAWYTGGSMSIPVTKFSLRLYGSAKAVEQEQERHEKAGSCVIHPYSNFRFYWDFVSLILLILTMLTVPVAISFFNLEMTTDTGWIASNLALDMWFLCDIIINFHTGIIEQYGDSEVILDLSVIRRRYLRSWFFIDIVSTIPIDYILQVVNGVSASASASRAMKLFRFAKLLSLLRLLRISRLIRYVHQWEEIVNVQYDFAVAAVRIFNLVCLMLLIGHWNGCLQFLIPMLYDFPADSWVVLDNLKSATWGEQYSWALFKAMSHMLCIGYGQKPPQNLMDLWMTMISMVSGAVCFAMFIGHTTALIQSLDSSKRQYKEKYMQVKEYMRYRHLPKDLRLRIYDYYENRFQGKMFDEQGILDEISPALREEVVNYNCRHLVASVPFFRNADVEFVTEVVQKLKYEVFQPNDIVVKENTEGKKMYFIQHGVVQISSSKHDQVTNLSDGSYFGEICLLTQKKRVATVRALTNCCLYSLHVHDFNFIVETYPIMRRTLETVAATRLSKIGRQNSVLERRINEHKSLDSESSEIVEEIVRHDEMKHSKHSLSGTHNFREENISSPSRKYLAFSSPRKSIFGDPGNRNVYRYNKKVNAKKSSWSMSDLKNQDKMPKKKFIEKILRSRKSHSRNLLSSKTASSMYTMPKFEASTDHSNDTVVSNIPVSKNTTDSLSGIDFLDSKNMKIEEVDEVYDHSMQSTRLQSRARSSPDGENTSDLKTSKYLKRQSAKSSRKQSSFNCNGVSNIEWNLDKDNGKPSPTSEAMSKLFSVVEDEVIETPKEIVTFDFNSQSQENIEVIIEPIHTNGNCISAISTESLLEDQQYVPEYRECTVKQDNASDLKFRRKKEKRNEKRTKSSSTPDVRLWVASPIAKHKSLHVISSENNLPSKNEEEKNLLPKSI